MFVSVQFNTVVPITCGLISVHSWRLACLISILAVTVYFLSTAEFRRVYAEAAWKHLPASEVSEEDVTEFLIFGLVRWISSFLHSASVIKAICTLVLFAVLFNDQFSMQRFAEIAVLMFACIWTGSAEWDMLQPITRDKSIYYYLLSSQLGQSLRAAFQVVYLISESLRWNVSMERSAVSRNKAHIFMDSVIILLLHNFNKMGLGGLAGFIVLACDIGLQLCIIYKTFKHFKKTIKEQSIPLLHSLLSLGISTLANVVFSAATFIQFIFSAATFVLSQLGRNCILRLFLTIIFKHIYNAAKVVVGQFFNAWRNYIHSWLNEDDDDEIYEHIQGERERNGLQDEPEFPFSDEHVQCNNLAQRHVVVERMAQPQQEYMSHPVLMEAAAALNIPSQHQLHQIRVGNVLTSSLCRLETSPCEEDRQVTMGTSTFDTSSPRQPDTHA